MTNNAAAKQMNYDFNTGHSCRAFKMNKEHTILSVTL